MHVIMVTMIYFTININKNIISKRNSLERIPKKINILKVFPKIMFPSGIFTCITNTVLLQMYVHDRYQVVVSSN